MKPRSSLALLLVCCAGCSNTSGLRKFDFLLAAGEFDCQTISHVDYDPVVVLRLTGDRATDLHAAEAVLKSDASQLDYWIEIARCPELADAHPEWMASLQGHGEWRRLFPDAPLAGPDEVIKNYPWVPIAYAETFDAHLARVQRMLAALPKPRRIYLNDLQGAPSACGCGNDACRWTSDYGPRLTATKLGPDAAARFVQAVAALAVDSQVVPVWMTECQEADSACAGVSCYGGKCWEAWTEQLMPLERVAPLIAVLEPLDLRATDKARKDGQSITSLMLRSFIEEPARHGGVPIAADRLIYVLQPNSVPGFHPDPERAVTLAVSPIDQSWSPRLVPWKTQAAQQR